MGNIKENIKNYGGIRLVLTDKNGNIMETKEAHNFVSGGNKTHLLTQSVTKEYQIPSGTSYGMMLTDKIGYDNGDATNNTDRETYGLTDALENIYALNLDSGLEMTSATKFLNLYDTDGNVGSKVIGYANYKRSVANTKEGIVDFCDGTAMADILTASNVWKWDLTNGNGTFNWLAIAPGAGVNKFRGYVNYKGIEKVNMFDSGSISGNSYIMPGAGNITGPYEILLSYTNGSGTRWKYNVQTGITTPVTDGIASTVYMRANTVAQYVKGDYLYTLDITGYMDVINTVNGTTIGSSNQTNYNTVIDYRRTNLQSASFFEDSSGNLYTSTSYSGSNYAYIRKINLGTATFATADTPASFAGLDNLPTGWTKNDICIASAGTRYYVTNKAYGTIICTDLANVKTTIIGALDSDSRRAVYYNSSVGFFFMRVGTGYRYPTQYIYNQTTLTGVNFYNTGVFFSADDFSNYISAYKFDTAVTKTNEQIMYIAYGYKFV